MAWALRHLPYYGRWYRFLLFWPACDGGLAAMRVDPDYPHPDIAISEINDAARQVFTQWMADQIGDDPELLAKVVPDYVCLGKRTLQDNGSWLGALTRDDVELVTDPIERIVADGVVTTDAQGHEHHRRVDVIVYATGFEANKFLWPMEIVGRGGAGAERAVGRSAHRPPRHHRPALPQPVLPLRARDQPGVGGQHHLPRGVPGALRHGVRWWPCWPGTTPPWRSARTCTTTTTPACRRSWTRWCGHTRPSATAGTGVPTGRIYGLSPWRLVDYWAWTKAPDLTEFELT